MRSEMHNLALWQRSLISDLASVIFPRTQAMPSAKDIDLGQNLLDEALRARPDLVVPLRSILDSVGDRFPSTFVSLLAADEPARFAILMQVVAGAYYLDPHVCAAIAYPRQTAKPHADATSVSPAFRHHTSRDCSRLRSV
jgi:pantothenate kinase-related protein Tda10